MSSGFIYSLSSLIKSVKLSLSSSLKAWPGGPGIAGYSQSKSIPSALYSSIILAVDFAKSILPSLVLNTSEQVLHPPHPPSETKTFRFGYFFFWSTIPNKLILSAALSIANSFPLRCKKLYIIWSTPLKSNSFIVSPLPV